MAKTTRRPPRRPPGGWEDATVLGKKLKAIRVGRGLTKAKASAQLGIEQPYFDRLEQGAFLPPRWMQERLFRWATKGDTFSRKEKRGHGQVAKAEGWQTVSLRLPPDLRQRAALAAERMGTSLEELVVLAIDRLLVEPGELVTYAKATERLARAKVSQALADNPKVRLFLESDLQLCIDMGAELVSPKDRRANDKAKAEKPGLNVAKEISVDDMDFSEWELK